MSRNKKIMRLLAVLAVLVLALGFDFPANTGAVQLLAQAQKKTSSVRSLAASAQAKKSGAKSPGLTQTRSPAPAGSAKQSAGLYDSAYINLSAYYLLPDQNFTVIGANFAPNEAVEILAAGTAKTVTADSSGRFSTDSFKLSMGDVNSTVEVSARGKTSGALRIAQLKVGTYYPQVAPSGYYVPAGSQVNFQGIRFAPHEEVVIKHDKSQHMVTADSSGSFNYQLKLDKAAALIFTGAYTQQPITVNVAVGPVR